MKTNDIKQLLQEHIKQTDNTNNVCADDITVTGTSATGREDAVLVLISIAKYNIETAALTQGDQLFVLQDWQSGYPHDVTEIEHFDWLTSDGRKATMLNGLPRNPLFF